MENNKKLDVVFILDKSGSMGGQEKNTISSFNEYLLKEKKNSYKTNITTVLFSDKYQMLHDREDVKNIKKLTSKEYYVEGCTALYDALGNTIHSFEKKKTDKVLFIIITDGYENSSKEYHKSDIKALISKHDEWEFIFVGADIDSYEAGSSIGIRRDNIANFKKDKKGLSKLFGAFANYECSMMEDEEVNTKWKQDLDDYIQKNEK